MSRVELLECHQAPLPVKEMFANGLPGPITRSLAQVPELLQATAPFLAAVFGNTAVPPRLKELVILRASARMQCNYCVQTHSAVALELGFTREEVLALRAVESPASGFSDKREQALLCWTDQVAGEIGSVDSSVADSLARHFTDAEVVELALLASTTVMLNRYCTALELPPAADVLRKLTEAAIA